MTLPDRYTLVTVLCGALVALVASLPLEPWVRVFATVVLFNVGVQAWSYVRSRIRAEHQARDTAELIAEAELRGRREAHDRLAAQHRREKLRAQWDGVDRLGGRSRKDLQ